MRILILLSAFLVSFRAFSAEPESAEKTKLMGLLADGRYSDLEDYATAAIKEPFAFHSGHPRSARMHDYLGDLPREEPERVWEQHLQRLGAWSKEFPESTTPRIMIGNTYINYAWKARGGGWASSVGSAAWKLFGERLAKARLYLEAAEKLSGKDPELYAALLEVAVGQGWRRPEMEAAFNKGININSNYLPLYRQKARYLLPRWHGKRGDWEAFATEAANARGGEEGDVLYTTIAVSQAWTEGDQFFKNTEFSYERIKRGFEGAVARFPSNGQTNCYAWIACIANDRETAGRLFRVIGASWEPSGWDDRQTFIRWQSWALGNGVRTVRAPASLPKTTRPGGWSGLLPKASDLGMREWCLFGLVTLVTLLIIGKACSRHST
jgi:hypothetical protein